MRHLNLISAIFVLILLSCSISIAQEWEYVETQGCNNIAEIGYYEEGNTIFLVADSGTQNSDSKFLITNASNISWNVWSFPDSSLTQAGFFQNTTISPNGDFFIAGREGVFTTSNDGVSWTNIGIGLPEKQTSMLSYNESLGLFAGDDGLYLYNDNSGEFELYDPTLPQSTVFALSCDEPIISVAFQGIIYVKNVAENAWHATQRHRDRFIAGPLVYDEVSKKLFYHVLVDSIQYYNVEEDTNGAIPIKYSMLLRCFYLRHGHLFVGGPGSFGEPYILYDYGIAANSLRELNVTTFVSQNIWPQEIIVDNRGVLYLTTSKGLYRTTEPVVTPVDRTDYPLHYQVSSYPSPVAPGSPLTVSYSLERAATLTLQIKDILGRTVREEQLGQRAPGQHTYSISTAGMEPGMYFYSLLPGNGAPMSGKMVVR